MDALYFGVYTLIIAIIWGFFIVLRLHAIKFNNFQTKIKKMLNILCLTLLVLSIVGYLIIFMLIRSGGITEVKFLQNSTKTDIKTEIENIKTTYY